MKRRIVFGIVCVTALYAAAMPSQSEIKEAKKLVSELMATEVADYKAQKVSPEQLGDAAVKYAHEAETEAGKFILLRGAIGYYVRADSIEKVVETFNLLNSMVKDIPPQMQSAILSKAIGRTTAKKNPMLYAIYRSVKTRADAVAISDKLRDQVVALPHDMTLRRRYAEALAASENWNAALNEYSMLDAPIANCAKSELAGTMKDAAIAESWWKYEPISENFKDIFKIHAAQLYRKAIEGKEITGIKRQIALKRMAEIGFDSHERASDETPVTNSERPQVPAEDIADADEDPVALKKERATSNNTKGNTLSGTQKEIEVTLEANKTGWLFTGEYVVPEGSVLSLGEGARLVFNKGVGLTIKGRIEVHGSIQKPVILSGKTGRMGEWSGINIEGSGAIDATGMFVRGAETGLRSGTCEKMVVIQRSAFVNNKIGCRRAATMTDCLISRNKIGCVSGWGAEIIMDHCSVIDNIDNGLGRDYGGYKLQSCIISGNGGHGLASGYLACNWTAHGCIIMNNKKYDVDGWGDLTGNYWGEAATRMLDQKGDGVNLPKIFDRKDDPGRDVADLSDYLKKTAERLRCT